MNDNTRCVLIVDDEPTNLELMMRILGTEYRLAFATSGVEALEATQKLNPDIILLDIMMPEMDGYETCGRLKSDPKTRDIPVVFVTAKVETEDEARGLELGAIDYIRKPVSPPIVKARIRNHLALKIAKEEIEKQNDELTEAARLREDVERIMRHDLKAPLNAVINFPRMLMNDPDLSSRQLEFLEVIEKAGLQMLNMVNLSLDLFKMERGIYELEPGQIDILWIVNRIFKENRHLLEKKALSETICVNGKPATGEDTFDIYGEDMLCYSMLANLIKNAIEASPKNERIAIDISDEKRGENRFSQSNGTLIAIHNKGAVPADIRDRFFDKYATSGKKLGSGLGTYSAKMIAEAHGGEIGFDTSDESGTTVTVRLPKRELNSEV